MSGARARAFPAVVASEPRHRAAPPIKDETTVESAAAMITEATAQARKPCAVSRK